MMVALGACALLACAQGGGGDTGIRVDGGDQDTAIEDGGAPDSGPPPVGDERNSHGVVASGHVSTSARYRLVLSTSSGGASTPSSSRYVLREHLIGRMAGR
jgi:hypothetical protein